jgi:hypothetical protein
MIVPPPRPTDSTSGMRKFVRMPPISTAWADCRGNPSTSTPMSVVVPPMSTTRASVAPERCAAPRIEFVGPQPIVSTGNSSAYSSCMRVPSF